MLFVRTAFRFLFALSLVLAAAAPGRAATRIPVTVARLAPGVSVVFGVPFPRGALASPDFVRVVDPSGREVPSQVTEVTTWEPAERSVKWAWVMFFTGEGPDYAIEFGDEVRRATPSSRVEVVNSQRPTGSIDIVTGRLYASVLKGESGFLTDVRLDLEGDGFEEDDIIAVGPQARGSFLDLVDPRGPDQSHAVVTQTFVERGSGPLHTVVRIEGEYRYGRDDNLAAPFVTRIHAYAGRDYLRVLHTVVYTGVPDRHTPREGEYPHIATEAERLTDGGPGDPGWTEPEDRIGAFGLALRLKLGDRVRATTAVRHGRWWAPGEREIVGADGTLAVTQFGPGSDGRIVEESGAARGSSLFSARVVRPGGGERRAERAQGWVDVRDGTRGVAIGVRHFLEEYPKQIAFDAATGTLTGYFWSPEAAPASFARASSKPGAEGSVENWAQGLAKTSEAILYFHDGRAPVERVGGVMEALLQPPVAHVAPAWYGESGVYGHFLDAARAPAALERSLAYRFEWVAFNKQWAPWYGVFDHGDVKQRFLDGRWDMWGHNEPAQDFQWWVQFMRTGDPRWFDAAQALSRHTMDVDNTHWPAGPVYRGDSNQSIDYFRAKAGPPASKWLGIGRRHAAQHWMHVLSAHVWVQGWLADYYLAADHRALDVARLTADLHCRRLWGEHEMTGRRLYLAAWNLVEVWDATKEPRYREELETRVERMLRLQQEDAGSLAIERYAYAQVYATHALGRYLSMTGDARVREALVRHARHVRDVPPLSYWMESLLATLQPLALAYELTGEESFRMALAERVALMRTDPLPRPIDATWTRDALAAALLRTDHLPPAPPYARRDLPERLRVEAPNWSPVHGIRFFGWTHGLSLPWAMAVLHDVEPGARESTGKP